MGVQVQGVDKLHRLGQGLKAFDDRKFKNSVSREIREEVKPAGEAARENARTMLPKRGGLNELVAKARVGARTRTSGKSASVSITMTQRKAGGRLRDLRHLDEEGSLRHPAFARPDQTRKQWTWVSQKVPSGFFTKAMQAQAPAMAKRLERVLDDVIKQVDDYIK
jgi:hypothetical protein